MQIYGTSRQRARLYPYINIGLRRSYAELKLADDNDDVRGIRVQTEHNDANGAGRCRALCSAIAIVAPDSSVWQGQVEVAVESRKDNCASVHSLLMTAGDSIYKVVACSSPLISMEEMERVRSIISGRMSVKIGAHVQRWFHTQIKDKDRCSVRRDNGSGLNKA